MNIRVLYRPNSEHERPINEFAHEFEHRTGHALEMVSLDTREGADLARLYDIVEYPAIIATDGDGILKQAWQGSELPLISDVESHLISF